MASLAARFADMITRYRDDASDEAREAIYAEIRRRALIQISAAIGKGHPMIEDIAQDWSSYLLEGQLDKIVAKINPELGPSAACHYFWRTMGRWMRHSVHHRLQIEPLLGAPVPWRSGDPVRNLILYESCEELGERLRSSVARFRFPRYRDFYIRMVEWWIDQQIDPLGDTLGMRAVAGRPPVYVIHAAAFRIRSILADFPREVADYETGKFRASCGPFDHGEVLDDA